MPFEGPPIISWKRSERIGQLIKALADAHLKFEVLKKEAYNPFYKSFYADLAAGIEASIKALSACELAILQFPVHQGGLAGVTTLLAHSSEEWVSCDYLLKVIKDDPQGVAGTVTYARRYARECVLDMAGEADDDGNLATGRPQEKKLPEPPSPKRPLSRTPGQHFWALARASGHPNEEIEQYIASLTGGSTSATDIPKDRQGEALKWAGTTVGVPLDDSPTG
jgi:hypothetical protein